MAKGYKVDIELDAVLDLIDAAIRRSTARCQGCEMLEHCKKEDFEANKLMCDDEYICGRVGTSPRPGYRRIVREALGLDRTVG